MHDETSRCPKGHELPAYGGCTECKRAELRAKETTRKAKLSRDFLRAQKVARPYTEVEEMLPASLTRAPQPIEAQEVPMRAKAKAAQAAPAAAPAPMPVAAPAVQLPVTKEAVHQAATEYKAFKEEMERVQATLARLSGFLKQHLPQFPGQEIEVDEAQSLYLCEVEPKRSFDLESAEETLAPKVLEKLEPYVKTVRTFDIKAAEKFVDLSKFRKYIKETPSTPQLRFRDKKEEA